ncbi:MAG: glycosyltransferase [Verrucomicrobia bacterium]|jgi:glycosyltransferase involved in cell wall biosynthesis|nr:glycosyltransferase [Verrucomicrobiota bacterium]
MTKLPDNWPQVSAALCHDWLTGMRGGERVLEILCEGFPEAHIYTLLADPSVMSETIRSHPIETSWMQRIPGISTRYRSCLPLFPAAVRNLHPPDVDLMVSTSHCVAKSIQTHPHTRHLCYCFTPMRYAWTFYDEYFGTNPAKAMLAKPVLAMLRHWDLQTASRVDRFVAISKHIQKRIQEFYGRESDVVYPPVDTDRCTPGRSPGNGGYDLVVSAMVPYKRVDLAVAAYTKLGYPLKVVGVGSKLAELKASAGANVEFLEWQADDAVLELYRGCRQLVFPGEEDFGIVPLEAQACGRPVVAYGCGGALETVADGLSGIFFEEQTETCLIDAVERCAAEAWDPQRIREHAKRFGISNFVSGLADSMQRCLS